MSNWCGPEEFLSVLCSSKLWVCARYLRSAALFALSRRHAPEFNVAFPMHCWHEVWKQCSCMLRKKNWPVVLWQDACVFMVREHSFVAHAPFFHALDAMLHIRHPTLSVSTVLAATLSIHPYEIHALLLVRSGDFAFLGSMEFPDSDSEDEDGLTMCCNVVVAHTLSDLEEAAVEFVASLNTTQMDVTLMPWHVDENGALKIYFCDEGVSSHRDVHIQDAFLPLCEDAASWQSAFTLQYLRVAGYVPMTTPETLLNSGNAGS